MKRCAMAANYVTLTDATFKEEVLESSIPVLVDFWAPWCGPCRAMAPVIEQLAEEFDGRAKIAKMNVDDNQQAPMQYGVRSIPTLLCFNEGEVVDQRIGVVPRQQLVRMLNTVAAQQEA